jgi:hypothetical protein
VNSADAGGVRATDHRVVSQRTTACSRRIVHALVVALIVVAAGCDSPDPGNARDATANTAATASAAASAAAADTCLHGSWRVTRATSAEIVNGDVVTFTNDGGAVWRFVPDGTGHYDFGSGTTYIGDHAGERIAYLYKGKVAFSFSTESVGRQLRLVDRRAEAETTAVVTVAGKSVWVPVGVGPDSLSYRCDDSSLEIIDEVRTFELRRI